MCIYVHVYVCVFLCVCMCATEGRLLRNKSRLKRVETHFKKIKVAGDTCGVVGLKTKKK